MLEKIRNDVAHNKLIRAMLIFTTLAFVAWGVGFSSLSLFSKNYAMKVGSIEIAPTEYYRAYLNAKNAIAQQLQGQQFPPELLKSLGIDISDEAIQGKVNDNFQIQSLLENFAKDNNIFVSPQTVLNILKQEPAFQKDGKFDAETYKAALRNANMTPIFFEKDIAKKMTYALITKLFQNSIYITDIELDTQIKHNQERRDAEIITITSTDVASQLPKATTEELETIYGNNKHLYLIPEKRDFNLLAISRDNVNQDVTVSDEEVKNYYTDNKDSYMTKREFNIKQILVADQEDADKVLAKKDLNKNFVKYVKEFSTDEISKKKDGDMGWLTADIFSSDITDVLNTTPKGAVSATAVKSPFGLHIFKIVDIKEPTQKSLKDVKAKVTASIKSEKIEDILREKTDTAIDLVSAGENLTTVSEQIGIKLKSISLAKQTDTAKYIPTVFSTQLNEVSESIDLDYDVVGFVEVTNIEEEFVKPLEEVKDKVETIYAQQKTQELLKTKANNVLKDIAKNKSTFTQAAKKHKLITPIKTAVSLQKENNQAKGVQQNVTDAIFDTDAKSINEEVLSNGAELVIVKVIDSYQETLSEEGKDKLRQALQAQKASDLYETFITSLEKQYPTKINQPMINSIVSQANSATK